VGGDDRLDAEADHALRAHHEAPALERVEDARLGLHPVRNALGAQTIAVDVVELTQRAGGRIARVREGLEAPGESPLVQALEARDGQHRLAAHRQPLGSGSLQRQRNAVAVTQVGGDVLAHPPIAPGGRHGQAPALVDELDAGAVELRLDHVGDLALGLQHAPDAFVEGAHLVRIHGVVEGEHGNAVRHLCEALGRRGADAPGGGVGARQLGVARFEVLELPEQAVVLRVRDLGRVLEVVEPAVTVQRVDQLVDPLARGCGPSRSQTAVSAGDSR
jgi:hypothetical protein